MKSGGLFAGYGGLDMAVAEVFGAEPAWFSEIDEAPSKILAHHWPDVPNHGDITQIDWDTVEPIELLTAGYPCQPFSQAGQRQGTDDARHLWPYVADALGYLQPELCVFENVRGHLTLGFDEVLRDLQLLNFDTRWVLLRAADVGAPHGRARIFILGRNRGRRVRGRSNRRGGLHRDPGGGRLVPGAPQDRDDRQGPAGAATDARSVRRQDHTGSTREGKEQGQLCLEAHRNSSLQGDRGAPALALGEGRSGSDRLALSGDGECGPTAFERDGYVDRRDAAPCGSVRGTDPGGEPPRAGSDSTTCSTRPAVRGLQVEYMVGPGRGLVWAGGILGPLPECRDDGSREAVRAAGLGGTRDSSATAPNAADIGHERGRASRYGWDGPEDDGDTSPNPYGNPVREQPTPLAGSSGSPLSGLTGAHSAAYPEGDSRRLGDGDHGSTTHTPGDGWDEGRPESAGQLGGSDAAERRSGATEWAGYGPAIERWERVLGRHAPPPTEPNSKGNPRLSPRFVEWMMGLPAGHVTDVPGVNRNAQLKALGNGVVPQQAIAALRHLTSLAVAA